MRKEIKVDLWGKSSHGTINHQTKTIYTSTKASAKKEAHDRVQRNQKTFGLQKSKTKVR